MFLDSTSKMVNIPFSLLSLPSCDFYFSLRASRLLWFLLIPLFVPSIHWVVLSVPFFYGPSCIDSLLSEPSLVLRSGTAYCKNSSAALSLSVSLFCCLVSPNSWNPTTCEGLSAHSQITLPEAQSDSVKLKLLTSPGFIPTETNTAAWCLRPSPVYCHRFIYSKFYFSFYISKFLSNLILNVF